MTPSIAILVLALGLVVSFFLSGMEAGVFALSRLRIRQLMRAGQPRAAVLYGYLEKPEDFLWTILVGNVLASFTVVSLAAVSLFHYFGSSPVLFWSVFLAVTFLFYALCELLPKTLFRMFPNRLCVALVGPFRVAHAILSPLVSLLSALSHWLLKWSGGRAFTGRLFGNREEFRLAMQESAQSLTSDERTMISRVLDLQLVTVGQIMTPMDRTEAVTTQTPMGDVLRVCREKHLTRLPVWQQAGERPRVTGVVSLKTLLYVADFDPARSAGDYIKPAVFVGAEMRLEEALRRIQRGGQRLAIVLDRDQREVGIVTLQDILKAVFGEVSL